MANKPLYNLTVTKKVVQFLFIFVGFMLLGSEQLRGQFYLISILGATMMLFGLFGIKEKSSKIH